MTDRIPDNCDYDCPFADFPPAETAGICRTMAAVWCTKLRELVAKNTPCEFKRRQAGGATPAATTPRKTAARKASKKAARRRPGATRRK